ncbi:GCN5-related N-acetyltransferase (fragment) [metagenome]|uniref:GCN5-related N-acetyltransferase n=1 Tax=metagenome TaxID=256318 RepID=A0A2P2C008_9ZZZZ
MGPTDEADLRLRPAAEADLPALAEIYLEARAAAAMPPGVHPEREVREWYAGWDLAALEVWVAETSGGVVGFAAVRESWLESLYVVPAAAGRGVGSALLDLVKAIRPDGFELWVFEVNTPARAFYRARGLTELERTDGSGNEEQAPDIRVGWSPPRD